MHKADMHKADMHKADMHKADMHKADMHKADMHKADMHKADMHKADTHRTQSLVSFMWHAEDRHTLVLGIPSHAVANLPLHYICVVRFWISLISL